MNMPGFAAEASLFNGGIHYQTTTTATVYGGFVQPAISDMLNLDEPVFSIFQFRRFNCLKRVCSFGLDVFGRPMYKCRWVSAIC
jgi:hypothetical protein